jgi:hypothetical protein
VEPDEVEHPDPLHSIHHHTILIEYVGKYRVLFNCPERTVMKGWNYEVVCSADWTLRAVIWHEHDFYAAIYDSIEVSLHDPESYNKFQTWMERWFGKGLRMLEGEQ